MDQIVKENSSNSLVKQRSTLNYPSCYTSQTQWVSWNVIFFIPTILIGYLFAEALAKKAREGVEVRVFCDSEYSFGSISRRVIFHFEVPLLILNRLSVPSSLDLVIWKDRNLANSERLWRVVASKLSAGNIIPIFQKLNLSKAHQRLIGTCFGGPLREKNSNIEVHETHCIHISFC